MVLLDVGLHHFHHELLELSCKLDLVFVLALVLHANLVGRVIKAADIGLDEAHRCR